MKVSIRMVGLARKALLRTLISGAGSTSPPTQLSSTFLADALDAAGIVTSPVEVQAELRHLAQQGYLQVDVTPGADVQVTGVDLPALWRLLGHSQSFAMRAADPS
jgi:hypothetical protein